MSKPAGFPFKLMVLAIVVAGTLDISAACIDAWLTSGTTPAKILNGIASGAIGKSNATGTVPVLLLGLAIHFFIVTSYSILFYFIFPTVKAALKNNFVIALLYGFFIWTSMRFLVLPVLSRLQLRPVEWDKALKAALILVVAIGIPLTWIMDRMIYRRDTDDRGAVIKDKAV